MINNLVLGLGDQKQQQGMLFMNIKVIAGDLEKGEWGFSASGNTAVITRGIFNAETYVFKKDIERVELLDEEKVKTLAGAAGWGLAGAALLGPLGAIGGILLGGNKKEVAFAAYFGDGRKFMATMSSKDWRKLIGVMEFS